MIGFCALNDMENDSSNDSSLIKKLKLELEHLKKENESLRASMSRPTSHVATQTEMHKVSEGKVKISEEGEIASEDFSIDLDNGEDIKIVSLDDSFNVEPFEVKTEPTDDVIPADNATSACVDSFNVGVAYGNGEEALDDLKKDQLAEIRKFFEANIQFSNDKLWKFLLSLLVDRDQKCIKWTGNDWEFYLADREEVARLWGVTKRRPRMSYEKMSRALRFYYSEGIISKCQQRFTYRFSDKLDQCIYSAMGLKYNKPKNSSFDLSKDDDLDSQTSDLLELSSGCQEDGSEILDPEHSKEDKS